MAATIRSVARWREHGLAAYVRPKCSMIAAAYLIPWM